MSSATGSGDIIVAIVDTGADLTHPDLQSNLWVNPGEIPGNGIDDDGNGECHCNTTACHTCVHDTPLPIGSQTAPTSGCSWI